MVQQTLSGRLSNLSLMCSLDCRGIDFCNKIGEDRVSSFRENFDCTFLLISHNDCHSLASWAKLNDVKQVVLEHLESSGLRRRWTASHRVHWQVLLYHNCAFVWSRSELHAVEFGSIYQSKLIWGLSWVYLFDGVRIWFVWVSSLQCLILSFVLFDLLLDYNCVAKGEMRQEIDDVSMVGVGWVSQMHFKFWIVEIEVCQLMITRIFDRASWRQLAILE